MQLQGKALRVTIYIGESDHYQGKALYMALLQLLKQENASGATVVRGLAGFGAHSRIHTATILDLSMDLPIRVEWIDQAELVERLLPRIRQMVDDGLITVEEVNVVQYAPGRRPDPLAQRVQDVMRTEVVAVAPQTSVAEIVTLLWQKAYRSLPVVDEAGHLVGIITDGDLLKVVHLSPRLDLPESVTTAQVQQRLSDLRQREEKAADMMTHPVITVGVTDTLRHAAALMVERHLKRLPVVNEAHKLVGWISRVDVLRTLEYHQQTETDLPETRTGGQTVAALMYRDVPTVRPQAQLAEIIQALEASQRRRVVVIDEARHVLGIVTDGDLLRRSQHAAHQGLLMRLRNLVTGQQAETEISLPEATETAAELMTTPVVTITTETTLSEALQLMLDHQIKRLPVVDEAGCLLGLLGRASLLQGLLQAIE